VGSSGFRAVITVQLNGIPLEMELDTGAKASVIYAGVFNALFKSQKLTAYTSTRVGQTFEDEG
jgi:hypothetical protein